jgi:hypothetical protein
MRSYDYIGTGLYSAVSTTIEMLWKFFHPLRAENDIPMNDTKPHYHSKSITHAAHPTIAALSISSPQLITTSTSPHDIDSYTRDSNALAPKDIALRTRAIEVRDIITSVLLNT